MAFPKNLPAPGTDSPFSDLKMNHIGLRVGDFDTAKRWYTEMLDFRVVHEWPLGDQQFAFLAPPNDDHFWVELIAGGNPPPAPKAGYSDFFDSMRVTGYHHFCMTVNDMDASIAELRKRGVTMVMEPFVIDVVNRKLAFFADPWGNLIEFCQVLAPS
jgi:catechol 2,3-dioxygenase-like lactoylglutathione lyase family enzyme